MKKLYFLFLLLIITGSLSYGQISITGTTYTENFDSMTATGTTTPTGWFVGSGIVANETTVAVSTGSSTGANNYNFGFAGVNLISDRALGSLASSTGSARNTEVRFINNTNNFITRIIVSYTGEQWRRATGAELGLKLYFSTDGTNFIAMGSVYDFNPPHPTGTAGLLDGNDPVNRVTAIGGTYAPPASIPNGSAFFLRWIDTDDTGIDGGVAIDDLSLTFTLNVLSIGKNEISNFSLYPNPVKGGKVFINSANNAERSIQIFDVLGKQVVSQKGSQNNVDVSHLTKGVYIIKVTEEGKTATRKLVVE